MNKYKTSEKCRTLPFQQYVRYKKQRQDRCTDLPGNRDNLACRTVKFKEYKNELLESSGKRYPYEKGKHKQQADNRQQ